MEERITSTAENDENSTEQTEELLLNNFNDLYSNFEKFDGCECKDSLGNAFLLSCRDNWDKKFWKSKSITVEANFTEDNSGNSYYSKHKVLTAIGLSTPIFWLFTVVPGFLKRKIKRLFSKRIHKEMKSVQEETKKYTYNGGMAHRVKFTITQIERKRVDWKLVTSFHFEWKWLDLKNSPHGISRVNYDDLENLLNWFRTILEATVREKNKKILANYKTSEDNDREDADNLLRENDLA